MRKNEDYNPILVIRCPKCKTISAGCVLKWGIDKDFSDSIIKAVLNGKEIIVTNEKVTINKCKCENEKDN